MPDRLPAACCLLPAACCLLPAACWLLPAACCLLSAACCLLPAACCLLPAACRPLPRASACAVVVMPVAVSGTGRVPLPAMLTAEAVRKSPAGNGAPTGMTF
jgi:hypothetical protein